MRVLIINTVRFKLNGISAVIKNYYDAMDKNGLEFEFVAIDKPVSEYEKWFEDNNLKYYIVKKSNPIKYLLNLKKVVKKGGYDVVHIHGNSANMALELLACKLGGAKVRIAHSHNTTTTHPTAHKLLYPLFSKLYTEALACGNDAGKWLFRDKPFEVLYNGIKLNDYTYSTEKRLEYREKINAEQRIVIGHIGNFVEQKNHGFMLDWFSQLVKKDKRYLLLLISDGYLFDETREKAHSLGLDDNVIFLGKTTEVSGFIQAMDMFVLPSLYEGLPVVLVEAQAAGLPCLVADTVSTEADMTGEMKFIPITDTEIWRENVSEITEEYTDSDRAVRCADWQKKISDRGYDIFKSSEKLKKIYFNSLK